MLKFGKLAILLVFVLSFGCKKDPVTQSEGQLIGKWKMTKIWSDNYKTTTKSGETTIESTSTLEGKNLNYNYEFKDDHTVSAGGSYTGVLTTTSQGQTIEQEIPGLSYAGNGKWTIDGKTLTIQEDGKDPQESTIISITDSELKLTIDFSQTINIDNQQASSTTTGTIHMEFTK